MRYYGGDSVTYEEFIQNIRESIEGGKEMAMEKEKSVEEVLLKQIEESEHELESLREQIKNMKRYDEYKKSTDELKGFYNACIESGFNEDQAFALTIKAIEQSSSK